MDKTQYMQQLGSTTAISWLQQSWLQQLPHYLSIDLQPEVKEPYWLNLHIRSPNKKKVIIIHLFSGSKCFTPPGFMQTCTTCKHSKVSVEEEHFAVVINSNTICQIGTALMPGWMESLSCNKQPLSLSQHFNRCQMPAECSKLFALTEAPHSLSSRLFCRRSACHMIGVT